VKLVLAGSSPSYYPAGIPLPFGTKLIGHMDFARLFGRVTAVFRLKGQILTEKHLRMGKGILPPEAFEEAEEVEVVVKGAGGAEDVISLDRFFFLLYDHHLAHSL
jgi:hypothetical protein